MALDAQWSAVARGYRNALIVAGALGVVAVVVALLLGEPAIGPLVCVGLGLGGYNARKLWNDTTSLDATVSNPRSTVMKTSLSRLGIITAFAILVALVYREDGWAVFVGLVVFQMVMMTLLLRPLRRVVSP